MAITGLDLFKITPNKNHRNVEFLGDRLRISLLILRKFKQIILKY